MLSYCYYYYYFIRTAKKLWDSHKTVYKESIKLRSRKCQYVKASFLTQSTLYLQKISAGYCESQYSVRMPYWCEFIKIMIAQYSLTVFHYASTMHSEKQNNNKSHRLENNVVITKMKPPTKPLSKQQLCLVIRNFTELKNKKKKKDKIVSEFLYCTF